MPKKRYKLQYIGSYDDNGKIEIDKLKIELEKIDKVGTIEDTNGDFPIKVVVDGYNITIDVNGNITLEGESSEGNSPTLTVPPTVDSAPFVPTGSKKIEGTIDTGLIMTDSKYNEWVWIEVPKSIYSNTTYNSGTAPTSSVDYDKIESVMQMYASDYRQSNWTDTFKSTEQHGFAEETDYDKWKNSMLKSVYENGGFYIGRYEVGITDARMESSTELPTPFIQRDKYPYIYITCSQAQTLAKQLKTGERTSSLMFGIQWDLVLKFIKEKEKKRRNN